MKGEMRRGSEGMGKEGREVDKGGEGAREKCEA